ncbi:3-oxoacyl-ACP reductase FabG [Thiothrix nivea]|uniref:3-oxoacyl-[acyl-carrier-protein] reductase n=1 Tax=Thiothrix nivea (strain ATCC 35100 / DSM 5205 / JP2) TaxID=870187 RepID=A0A656HC21_THINJ|nr:3-oxoacyl-ACP reductase FabG [Thiothrix nivea]EIJ32956.1 3-oxoacyl-(acyl-carrier-protein) reductase [Thiothrix nivea DSM 5205]
MDSLISLQGEIALVTGASRGIGRSIAEMLGKAGATVIGTATSEKGAEAISTYMSELGISGKGMMLNVADKDSIDGIVKAVNGEFGAITVLVNNAGITRDNLLMRMKDEEWDDIIATNLTSIFRMSKACMRGMTKAKKGRIISISSVVGASGNPGQTNYAAAKAGLVGFSKSLAREIGSRGITVNVVAPGFIDTDMTRELSEDQRSSLLQNIPLARLGQPDEIAGAVLFLASSLGAYITGETIHVNGGMYMA